MTVPRLHRWIAVPNSKWLVSLGGGGYLRYFLGRMCPWDPISELVDLNFATLD